MKPQHGVRPTAGVSEDQEESYHLEVVEEEGRGKAPVKEQP